MSFNDVIQNPGRIITKRIYRRSGNTYGYINNDEFISARLGFNYKVGDGTVCRYLELETKSSIGVGKYPDYVRFYIYARASAPNSQEFNKTYGPFYSATGTPEYDANSKTYIYKLYDSMIWSMVPYEPITATYPITVQNYFNTIMTTLGYTSYVTLSTIGSKELTEDIYEGLNLTYRDVINDILQADGSIGYIISGSTFTSTTLRATPVPISITDDILKNTNVSIGTKFGPINSLTLSRASGTDTLTVKDDTSITQNGLTNITIADNMLLSGDDRRDYIQSLFDSKYKGAWWYLQDCELTGYGGFNFGDRVYISTGGTSYMTIVHNTEMVIDQAFSESIWNTMETAEEETSYTYNSTDQKADKEATIMIDKKIGEVDIRGKTVNLTADNIKIESNNFKVNADGDLICNSATMNNSTITGGNIILTDEASSSFVTDNPSIIIYNKTTVGNYEVGRTGTNAIMFYDKSLLNYNGMLYRLLVSGTISNEDLVTVKVPTDDGYDLYRYNYNRYVDGDNVDEIIYRYRTVYINDVADHTDTYIIRHYQEGEETLLEYNDEEIPVDSYEIMQISTRINTYPRAAQFYELASNPTRLTGNGLRGRIETNYIIMQNFDSSIDVGGLEFPNNYGYRFTRHGPTGWIYANMGTSSNTFELQNTSADWTFMVNGIDATPKNKILWGPSGWVMNATQTVTLNEKVSEQAHGIVLVWSAYTSSGGAQNYNWHCHFVPKEAVAAANSFGGNGFCFQMASSKFGNMATKYVYISDTTIKGNADNSGSTNADTAAGVKYTNGAYVLRYVIGV